MNEYSEWSIPITHWVHLEKAGVSRWHLLAPSPRFILKIPLCACSCCQQERREASSAAREGGYRAIPWGGHMQRGKSDSVNMAGGGNYWNLSFCGSPCSSLKEGKGMPDFSCCGSVPVISLTFCTDHLLYSHAIPPAGERGKLQRPIMHLGPLGKYPGMPEQKHGSDFRILPF